MQDTLGRTVRLVSLLTLISLWAAGVGTASSQSPGTFTPTGRMTVARTLHTATLLTDGKVLIAGGRIHREQDYRGTVTATAELYDPLTGTFSPTGSMTLPRVWHSATLLPNGKVLIVGRDSLAGDDRTAELYDPSTRTFTRTADTLSAQYGASATLLKNGKVLIAGGVTPGAGNSLSVSAPELYDPSAGTFAATGRFVGPGDGFFIVGGPNSPSVTRLSDGRVLFAAEPFSELYDPETGTFTATGAMKTTCGPLSGAPNYISTRTATLLASGDVLVAGGGHEDCGRFAQAENYAPVSGTFTLLSAMTRRRAFHTATRLPDDTVLIAGGESESGFSLVTEATAEIYDPVSDTFTVVGSMQQWRAGHTSTLLADGRVLLAGGAFFQDVGNFLGSLASADLYAPDDVAPSRLVATASGSGVVLTWTAPAGRLPLRYEIRGHAAHTSTPLVVVTPDASTHYAIPALSPDAYSFTVRAIFASSRSSPSNGAAVIVRGHSAKGIQKQADRRD
jgi:hypothetical protein